MHPSSCRKGHWPYGSNQGIKYGLRIYIPSRRQIWQLPVKRRRKGSGARTAAAEPGSRAHLSLVTLSIRNGVQGRGPGEQFYGICVFPLSVIFRSIRECQALVRARFCGPISAAKLLVSRDLVLQGRQGVGERMRIAYKRLPTDWQKLDSRPPGPPPPQPTNNEVET